MIKKCEYCNKKYTPKSNNSKYCSKECKSKRDYEWKQYQRHNNPKWREHVNKKAMERFKKRYHNEPGYKEKHVQNCLSWREENR